MRLIIFLLILSCPNLCICIGGHEEIVLSDLRKIRREAEEVLERCPEAIKEEFYCGQSQNKDMHGPKIHKEEFKMNTEMHGRITNMKRLKTKEQGPNKKQEPRIAKTDKQRYQRIELQGQATKMCSCSEDCRERGSCCFDHQGLISLRALFVKFTVSYQSINFFPNSQLNQFLLFQGSGFAVHGARMWSCLRVASSLCHSFHTQMVSSNQKNHNKSLFSDILFWLK